MRRKQVPAGLWGTELYQLGKRTHVTVLRESPRKRVYDSGVQT